MIRWLSKRTYYMTYDQITYQAMKVGRWEEKVTPSVHKAEVKFLTVAFWDIRGFSKLCDT